MIRTTTVSSLRGVAIGACAGACVGVADVARNLVAGREGLQPGDELVVIAFYASCFALFGLVAALTTATARSPQRALHLVVLGSSALFFVGAWMNVTLLPGALTAPSIAANACLLLAAALWFRVAYTSKAEGGRRGLLAWILVGLAATGIAALLGALVPPRSQGLPPRARASDSKRPNVLLYVVDTLRGDRLGYAGYSKATSPEIDAFARDATIFTDCHTVASWTKPAVASLMTGQYPSVHSTIRHGDVLAPQAETLPEIFQAAGWRTAAFVDNPYVTPEFGFGQGFAQDDFHYDRPSVLVRGTLLGRAFFATGALSLARRIFPEDPHVERGANALHRELIAFARSEPARPWFAYVHAMEPHAPYRPDPADALAMGLPSAAKYLQPPLPPEEVLPFGASPDPSSRLLTSLQAQYDGEIRGFSRAFGALVQQLRDRRWLENTIVVLTADHGEEFHEHGGWQHGHSLYRELTHVPLLIRVPELLGEHAKASRGSAVDGVATILDIRPTLLELAGVRYVRRTALASGALSLVPALLAENGVGPSILPRRRVLAEVAKSGSRVRALRDGRWQLIDAVAGSRATRMLFDVSLDPYHLHDRSGSEPVEIKRLSRQMADSFRDLEAVALTPMRRDIDAETEARLRALGYAGD